jgi:hypothetical protein
MQVVSMKIILLVATLFCFSNAFAQVEEVDSCAISPTLQASFEGIDKKGMISTADLTKFKKLVPSEPGTIILRFTYSIDCDGCEIEIHEVYADTLSGEDVKRLAAVKPMQVISFECIIGKNRKGELVNYKPFLFYVKQ